MDDACDCAEDQLPEECYECGDREDIAGHFQVDGWVGQAAFCTECLGPFLKQRNAAREQARRGRQAAEEARLLAAAVAAGPEEGG